MDPLTAAFEDVERLILYTTHEMWAEYNRKDDFQELLQEAKYWFVVAFYKHDENRSGFVTTVKNYVRWGLQKYKIRKAVNALREPTLLADEALDAVADNKRHFSLELFADGMSEDAKIVLGLVFDPPIDIIADIISRGKDTATRHRSAIRMFLKYLGWSRGRIEAAFTEIKEGLR